MTHPNKPEGYSSLEALFSELGGLLGTVLSRTVRILRLLWDIQMQVLNAVGLPELVTDSLDQYAALALNLARDRAALEAIRDKLARNIKTEPLYDTDLYRRHLEAAYHTMWQRHQRGEPPKGFTVEKT